MFVSLLPRFIFWAGAAQLVLALGSIAIPFLLKWKEEMQKVQPLIRSIFYTYSVYIFSVNIWFGVISMLMPDALCKGDALAGAVTVFAALYWLGRVAIQFVFGKAEGRPSGILFLIAEIGLWALFIALSLVYSLAALLNLGMLS